MTATPCTFGTCRRSTTHPSGRCHDHRQTASSRSRSMPTPAPASAPLELGDPVEGDSFLEVRTTSGGGRSEVWFDNDGDYHRAWGPAETRYDPAGQKINETWMDRGSFHRVGGPAVTDFGPGGVIVHEQWWVDGVLHRIDGPAETAYDDSGQVVGESWMVQNKPVRNRAEAVGIVSGWSDHEIREEIGATPLAPLLTEGHGPRTVLAAIGEGLSTVEGMRSYFEGAPLEWVRSFEEGRS